MTGRNTIDTIELLSLRLDPAFDTSVGAFEAATTPQDNIEGIRLFLKRHFVIKGES